MSAAINNDQPVLNSKFQGTVETIKLIREFHYSQNSVAHGKLWCLLLSLELSLSLGRSPFAKLFEGWSNYCPPANNAMSSNADICQITSDDTFGHDDSLKR